MEYYDDSTFQFQKERRIPLFNQKINSFSQLKGEIDMVLAQRVPSYEKT